MDCVQFEFKIYIWKFMKTSIPSVSKQLSEERVFNAIDKNYSQLTKVWFNFQMDWLHSSYRSFKDHDKFLIIQYLVYRTLTFFSNNFVKLDFDNYYSKNQLEIANFSIVNISRDLSITKETARRKILELEKSSAIIKDKKKIILNGNAFKFQRPSNSIGSTSYLLSKITETLSKNGDIDKKLTSETIESYMRKNFTHCWKLFYEMQIPLTLNWKKIFKDIETFHIWAVIATQKSFGNISNQETLNREKYIQDVLRETKSGINAMSVSDLTGIPRATVVRKINNLLKKKLISVDKKKLYTPKKTNIKTFTNANKKGTTLLTIFFCKIINLIQAN